MAEEITNNQDSNKVLLKLKDYIPFLTLMALIFSTANLFFYYQSFNLNIFAYIGYSEILSLSLKTLMVTGILFYCVSSNLFSWKQVFSSEKKLKRSNLMIALRVFSTIIAATLFIWLAIYLVNHNKYYSNILLSGSLIFGTNSFIEFMQSDYLKRHNILLDIHESLLFKFSRYFISVSILLGLYSYNNVIFKNPYLGTTIYFKDKTLKSDDVNYYIGQSDKYIFFHNIKDDSNNIYLMSEVKSIELKKNINNSVSYFLLY